MVQTKILRNSDELINRDINECLRTLAKQNDTSETSDPRMMKMTEIMIKDVKLYKFNEKETTALIIYDRVVNFIQLPVF